MSIDPGTLQQMLAQQLMQPPQQPAPVGGGGAGPQMQGQTTPQNATAQMIQKILAMKAMQNQPQGMQQQQAQGMLPGTQQQIAADPKMQALQQSPQLPPVQFPQQ
jgi:hypothetical protein